MNAIGDVVFNENVKTTFYYKVESQSDAKIPLPLLKTSDTQVSDVFACAHSTMLNEGHKAPSANIG